MERKYVNVVEQCVVKADGTQNSLGHLYFSTYDKAAAYIKWLHACIENNGGTLVNDNFFMSSHKLPSGDEYLIKCNKCLLDGVEIGEA